MLYVIRSDETLEELPAAVTAEVEGDFLLVCRDADGNVVAHYDKLTVLMVTPDAHLIPTLTRHE